MLHTGALHDLAADQCADSDPLGGGPGGLPWLRPVAAQHADWLGITDDGHVQDPLEQRGLGAEADVDGARPGLGAPGNGLQRGGQISVLEEQRGMVWCQDQARS